MAEAAVAGNPATAPAEGGIVVVVRAPNQEIQDFRVECPGTWTVRELKDHLQQTYNGNPVPKDQKLIYSGQLLEDAAVLKNALRHEGASPSTHTVHLVCRPPKSNMDSRRPTVGSSAESRTAAQSGSSADSQQRTTNTIPAQPVYQMTHGNNTELRFRMPHSDPTTASGVQTTYTAHILAMQNMYAQYYHQLLAHQQAVLSGRPTPPVASYLFNPCGFSITVRTVNGEQSLQQNPYLFNQFHQFNNLNDNNNDATVNNNNLNPMNNNNPNMNNLNNNNDNNFLNNENANNNAAAAAAAAAGDDDDNVRDWDDYVYMVIRSLLLVMLIYLYSSTEKLVLVTGLGILFWIYQHLRMGVQQPQPGLNPQAPEAADAAAAVNPGAADREDIERLQAAMDNENRGPMPGPGGVGHTEAAVAPHRSPIVAIANVLKAFFVSLIP